MEKTQSAGRMAGLDILAAGRRTQNVKSRLKHWRTLNAFALVYICEGSGSFESNETAEVNVKAGDCFFLFPGVSHFYGPPGQTIWKEIWVLFRGNLAEYMLKENTLNPSFPVTSLHATRRSEFQRNLESLVELYRNKANEFRLRSTALLYNCLLQSTLPLDSPPPISGDSILLDEMKLILRRHMGSSRKIPGYFHNSRYSYNTLRMEFQRLTGESPGQYLRELRMQHAEEQLLWSGLSITDICMGLGFTDSRYFSRAFKKHAGSSPREFRQRYHLIR
ncbi:MULTISPECIES: AraC family transcriptional regulator [unclassified Oceanispirochaeta]|uniref:AraC family transcriptional regulator n=1 Tax=unclassified Oceanispirochaeta TaxID=2635722 RepID=UPI000E091587|nr:MULTISPECIES: AraC family transcriptional regulator [unclassified Oceanispirochaeta]MBF9014184.1 AraC family transcriptional regulator [Oceanispirochaeta sp. M2]NPD70674.1 AraC family transcriptional regulator [Oceanispirochaeta sp. M1]RDG34434.1 AraC family transcriptional regulator [Oceanispirochaeta sp. M1]